MANSVFYAAVLDNKLSPIKARLADRSAARGPNQRSSDELP